MTLVKLRNISSVGAEVEMLKWPVWNREQFCLSLSPVSRRTVHINCCYENNGLQRSPKNDGCIDGSPQYPWVKKIKSSEGMLLTSAVHSNGSSVLVWHQ
ncbi:hypothetical protein TNCT_244591 [Trichonephila clavata]|uniref:Uncharacterized protein n=1 Tax=Trichonephila clavata TaxID=2740835 RepID=A0A8X6IRJ1_TRICU|nr:hypothetical protein TNCT_244591 [Trichonephila clavata]